MDFANKISKTLKKKVELSLFDKIPEEIQKEFTEAGGVLDFNVKTSQLHITNCPTDLAERIKEVIKEKED